MMVTKNGRPLTAVEDEGLRIIIDPILKSLNLTINRRNICDWIERYANDLREKIKLETKNKIVCIKMDGATRHDRHILGINLQLILDGKIAIRHIAMVELTESATSEYLAKTLINCLKTYNIKLDQVYSITSDNAANMIKCVQNLSEMFMTNTDITTDEVCQDPDDNANPDFNSNDKDDDTDEAAVESYKDNDFLNDIEETGW